MDMKWSVIVDRLHQQQARQSKTRTPTRSGSSIKIQCFRRCKYFLFVLSLIVNVFDLEWQLEWQLGCELDGMILSTRVESVPPLKAAAYESKEKELALMELLEAQWQDYQAFQSNFIDKELRLLLNKHCSNGNDGNDGNNGGEGEIEIDLIYQSFKFKRNECGFLPNNHKFFRHNNANNSNNSNDYQSLVWYFLEKINPDESISIKKQNKQLNNCLLYIIIYNGIFQLFGKSEHRLFQESFYYPMVKSTPARITGTRPKNKDDDDIVGSEPIVQTFSEWVIMIMILVWMIMEYMD